MGLGLIKAEFFGATAKNYNEVRWGSFGKRRGVKLGALPCLPAVLGSGRGSYMAWRVNHGAFALTRDTFRPLKFSAGNSAERRGTKSRRRATGLAAMIRCDKRGINCIFMHPLARNQ